MNILGIESSCDETAAAVVKNGRQILSSVVATQLETHQRYSGVVPELASRAHTLEINGVISKAIQQFQRKQKKRRPALDAIGVTVGPGLAGSLLVGRMTAEALGWVLKIPVVGVNHIEGHLFSPILVEPKLNPPFLGLVVSGGHTELIYASSWSRLERLGQTRDDAAGEAFDKVAKMLNLGYPGGPVIDQWAKKGDPKRSPFPRPWLPGTWDFSFSGLKTAVLYRLRRKKKWSQKEKQDLCAGFQASVVEVLVKKTLAAARALKTNRIVVGGGVAANSQLRREMIRQTHQNQMRIFLVPPSLCTDNAAMIAAVSYFKLQKNKKSSLRVQPQLHLPTYQKKLKPFSLP